MHCCWLVFSKITNLLIKATEGAAKRDASYLDIVAQLRARHIRVVEQLLGGGSADASDPTAKQLRQSVLAALDSDFNDLSYILRAVWLSRAFDPMHNWWSVACTSLAVRGCEALCFDRSNSLTHSLSALLCSLVACCLQVRLR